MTWQQRFETALNGFGARVHQVQDWGAPTPDTEWDVSDLVKHVIVEQQWFPPLVRGLSLDAAGELVKPLADDLVAEWDKYAAASIAAVHTADPAVMIHLSYGDATFEHYTREMATDAVIHTWDLAKGIGADPSLDPELVSAIYAHLEPNADQLAASGLFAPPVAVPEEAPLQDKLIALTGRQP